MQRRRHDTHLPPPAFWTQPAGTRHTSACFQLPHEPSYYYLQLLADERATERGSKMAAGKHHQQQQGVVAAAEPGVARRLWRVVRAVLYMLRRGMPSGRKLAMDLHLLLHRGKIAGKALGDLLFLAFHHHHHHHRHAAAAFSYAGGAGGAGGPGPFSCRALDPTLAVHEPAPRGRREVEFSCSNTPSSTSRGLSLLGAGKRRRRSSSNRHHDDSSSGYLQCWNNNYDAAEVARMFEMLNDDDQCYRGLFAGEDGGEGAESTAASSAATSAAATPSRAQMLYWAVVGSPAVRRSRTTTPRRIAADESPAPAVADGVDRKADEFIRRGAPRRRRTTTASTPTSPRAPGGRRPSPPRASLEQQQKSCCLLAGRGREMAGRRARKGRRRQPRLPANKAEIPCLLVRRHCPVPFPITCFEGKERVRLMGRSQSKGKGKDRVPAICDPVVWVRPGCVGWYTNIRG
ncbi:hypothetical protein HU200_067186 [Digitaria exilis]|uniref:Uncharacterized protein n=1 Tax=Digitaria exilis TaxID=1010633 RepID=A0A835DVZ7_9POAL|nr:hypothetical protein HU200_067186 [Digitaria exilis]